MSEPSNRHQSGTYFTMGLWGEQEEGATLSCCHCQMTRRRVKGSGRAWFWCAKCDAIHCDNPACFECVPVERRMENSESGRPELTPAPASIVVPDSALWGTEG